MRNKDLFMRRNDKGFTLIELMFAVVILLVSILALLSGFIGSLLLNNSSNNLTTAVNDAQYVLEQIKGLDYDTCIDKLPNVCYILPTFNNLPGVETVALDPPPATIGTGIKKITVKVSWQDKGQQRSFSLATYFAK